MKIILASESPRRRELLRLITDDFEVFPQNIDETSLETSPERLVMDIARRKAAWREGCTVIGADTVVCVQGEILGKPRDIDDARRMLELLSRHGMHEVFTGVCVTNADGVEDVRYARTEVFLRIPSKQEIEKYLQTGEYADKAGAYGIQGYAARFISAISGCYYNVMGLPVSLVYEMLIKVGFGSVRGCSGEVGKPSAALLGEPKALPLETA